MGCPSLTLSVTPPGQVEFRRVLQRCMEEMSRASFKLLEALSLGLDLPAHTLRPFFQVPGCAGLVWSGLGWLAGTRKACQAGL